ncbi:MAG TPA: hypothetical protein VFB43_20615 [Terracidiphilus sp.]|jgi:hypothetical protein|nr:hypothetical protein [Terracidiphilus sp.]
MRTRFALAIVSLALGVVCRIGWTEKDAVGDRAVVVDFSNPELSPSHWILTLHPDGSGHFHSEMGKSPQGSSPEIDAPDVDRDVQLSSSFTSHIFETAQRHKFFNEDCDSHLKVAFQGWKKLSYSGRDGSGSCTFNFSKDKEIQALGDSMNAVAETILEGARLEMLLQHDRLGLDKEMEFLVDAAGNGRAQQICAIRGILTRLAEDDAVLERVRKRAKQLLAQGDT